MSEKLNEATVLKVASLSRLDLSPEEVQEYTSQLGNILDYIAILDEIDVSEIEPMAHAVEFTNVLRADKIAQSLPREKALANAPKTDGDYFPRPANLG